MNEAIEFWKDDKVPFNRGLADLVRNLKKERTAASEIADVLVRKKGKFPESTDIPTFQMFNNDLVSVFHTTKKNNARKIRAAIREGKAKSLALVSHKDDYSNLPMEGGLFMYPTAAKDKFPGSGVYSRIKGTMPASKVLVTKDTFDEIGNEMPEIYASAKNLSKYFR